MQRFQNILVAVDLSRDESLVAEDLSASTREAVAQALWLARGNHAKLRFFYSLDVDAHAEQFIVRRRGQPRNPLDRAEAALAKLVQQAAASGVSAQASASFGPGWREAIRHVLRDGHDLVIAGGRRRTQLQGLLLGGNTYKLLRKCPCPVWVAQPASESGPRRVLAATDFSPLSDLVVDLAASMAKLRQAELHVLHVVEAPSADAFVSEGEGAAEFQKARADVLRVAQEKLAAQLARPSVRAFGQPACAEIMTGSPARIIADYLHQTRIDLLVMGTLSRAGMPGKLLGGMAEQILPDVTCSLLALKSGDFETPVTLD